MTTKQETNHFEQGKNDAINYYSSQAYSGLTRNIKAEDAMKLFWPAPTESMSQISTPYPKPIQKWLKGFRKGQAGILTIKSKKQSEAE